MTPRPDPAYADLFQPPPGGSLSCPDEPAWKVRRKQGKWKHRLARSKERTPWVVISALPTGTVRPASQKAWLDVVEQSDALATLRADAYQHTLAVARQLMFWTDWETMTTRPGWDVLAARTDLSLRSVCRAIERLKAAGLLGVVASGRSAACQTVKGNAGAGDVAVYVLAVPSPLQLVPPVDESGAPSVEETESKEPTSARETANSSPEPLRGPHPLPADAGAALVGPIDRTVVRLPGRATRAMRLERRKAQARRVQLRVPILQTTTTAYVAAVLRDFALAGWTDSDVVESIDWLPGGVRQPHSGTTGVDPDPRSGAAARWLEHRLAAWRDEAGDPLPSPSTVRLAAARARIAAQLQARSDDAAAADGRPWVQYSAGFAAFKAARAALPRRTPR